MMNYTVIRELTNGWLVENTNSFGIREELGFTYGNHEDGSALDRPEAFKRMMTYLEKGLNPPVSFRGCASSAVALHPEPAPNDAKADEIFPEIPG